MVMKALREGAKGGIGRVILFGFMGMAVGGLVLMDVGGFFRTGTGNGNVLKIGKQSISIQEFDVDMRRQLSRVNLSPQDAYKLGYTNQILAGKVRQNLIQQAAIQNGVQIDKKRIAQHVSSLIAPMVQENDNPKDVLRQILASQGMSEGQFVASISNEISIGLITKAMGAGFSEISKAMIEDMYTYEKETRKVEYAPILSKNIKNIDDPTDEQLQALYNISKENYAILETRTVKMLRIKDKALKDSIEISEDELLYSYEEALESYFTPETITVEQALLDTEEQAKVAVKKLNKKKKLKNLVKAAAYLGEQTKSSGEFLEAVEKAITTNKEKGAIIGPVQTPLGWNVTVIKKITPEHTKSFAEVKDQIKDELLEIAVLDQKYALAGTVDDLLASGASIEDIAEEVPVEITDLGNFNNFGLDANNKDALKNFDLGEMRAPILEATRELLEGETSPVMEMDDGSFRAVYVEAITPKSYQPFEAVKPSIKKRWITDQKRAQAYKEARDIVTEVVENNADFAKTAKARGYKIKKLSKLVKGDEAKAPLVNAALGSLFEAPILEPIIIDIKGGAAVAIVTQADIPKLTQKIKDSDEYKEFAAGMLEETQREGITIYLEGKRKEIGVKVNQALLERAYGAGSEQPY